MKITIPSEKICSTPSTTICITFLGIIGLAYKDAIKLAIDLFNILAGSIVLA